MFRNCVQEKFEIYAKEVKAAVRLDLSTNPLGPSPRVLNVLKSADLSDAWKYPDLGNKDLEEEIARFVSLKKENVLLTTGADHGIEISLLHLLEKGKTVAIHVPTFPRFEIVARNLCDANVKHFEDVNNIPESDVLVFCSPNNPTTEEIKREKLISILEERERSMVILDNVFCEFGEQRFSDLVSRFSNLIILRSFSKDFGLAGIRLGFILSSESNIEILGNGSCVFPASSLSRKIALEALKDREHMEKTKRFLKKEFSFIRENLGERVSRKSNVPFFLFRADDSVVLRDELLKQGIAITDAVSFKSLDRSLARVSIAKREENELFIEAAIQFK